MALDLEYYWNLPQDIFIQRMISEGFADGIQLHELRFGSIPSIYSNDHNDKCSIAERVGDFKTLHEQRCFSEILGYLDHFYKNDAAPLETAFRRHDKIAFQYISANIREQGYGLAFSLDRAAYDQFAYAISANDTGALKYLINLFPSSIIIDSENHQEPLLSLAYRQQNLEIATLLHGIHNATHQLAFTHRFLVQSLPLHNLDAYLAHANNTEAVRSIKGVSSVMHTVYGTSFKPFSLQPGWYDLCKIFAMNIISDDNFVVEKEYTRCLLYTQDPIVRSVIAAVVAYIISTEGFFRIYVTSLDAQDTVYGHPKPSFPFHFHTIFVSINEGFISSRLIHEAGHFIDGFLNRNHDSPYKGEYQHDEFLVVIDKFLNNVAIYLLHAPYLKEEKNLENKIRKIRAHTILIACESSFHSRHGDMSISNRLRGVLQLRLTENVGKYLEIYCTSEILIFTMHRIYEWAGRRVEDRHAELLGRLPEILTQMELTETTQRDRAKVLHVLEPLREWWDKEYRPALTVFLNTTQCTRSIFFIPQAQNFCPQPSLKIYSHYYLNKICYANCIIMGPAMLYCIFRVIQFIKSFTVRHVEHDHVL